jgi:hypothetical protein
VQLARQLAALWQQAKETGQVPAQTRFRTEGQMGARLAQIAAHAQDAVQSNGLFGHMRFFVDPRDPLVEVAEADGSALACQAVRETAAYRPPAGGAIVQDDARQNWGRSLAPGQYATVTNHGAWQTCFLISRNAHAPVIVLNQDVDGGFPTATEASGSGQDQA